MKAIIYTRWSPRPDADTTQSTEAQLALCRHHCRAKGYVVHSEHHDKDVSGDDEERTGLWAAVEQMRRGRVLLCSHPDRLARSVYLEECIYREAEKTGCQIEFVEGGQNGSRPEDELIRRILSFFREYQKKVAAARTKAHMLEHQRAGWAMSHHAPYGFREGAEANGKRRWEPDDAEQAVIARIAQMAAQGLTAGQICRRLADSGTECRGKSWHRETIRRILSRHLAGNP